ncbi:MAG: hypothetical protein J6B81_03650 [Spirochaetaceae bacterium]|nr:hypothetical protein [Spirochaetaceae bacterium]
MKKLFAVIACIFVLSAVMAQSVEPVRKVWNDGTTDYIPLGTEFQLRAENLDPETGDIIYTYNSGEATVYQNPVPLTEEGPIVISWATKDLWGNITNAKTYSAIVDGTAPEVKFLVNGPSYMDSDGIFYVRETTGIQLFGEDELSGTEHIFVNLGEGDLTDVKGDTFVYLVDREDGEIAVECVAVDYVGNASDKFESYIYLDNTAPTVYIDIDKTPVEISGVQYVSPTTKFTLSARDELAGVEGIYLSLDGQDFAKYDASQPLMVAEPGEHVIRAYAKDNLGNVSSVAEMSFSTRLTLPPANLYLNVGNQSGTTTQSATTNVEK